MPLIRQGLIKIQSLIQRLKPPRKKTTDGIILFKVSILLLCLLGPSAPSLLAQEDASLYFQKEPLPIWMMLEGNFSSEYIFRGQKRAKASFQPMLLIGYPILKGQAYGRCWMNVPIHKGSLFSCEETTTLGNELDLTLGYQMPLALPIDALPVDTESLLSIDAGYTYYHISSHQINSSFSRGKKESRLRASHEIFLGLNVQMPFQPSCYAYYDFDKEQIVLQLSTRHTLPLEEYLESLDFAKNLSIELDAYCGYLNAQDALGDQKRKNNYRASQPSSNPQKKWGTHYLFWGLSSTLSYAIHDALIIKLGLHYCAHADSTKKYGPQPCPAPHMGGHSAFLWWTAGASLSF